MIMSLPMESNLLTEQFYRMLRLAATDPNMRSTLFALLKLPAEQCKSFICRLDSSTDELNDLKTVLSLLQDKQMALAVRRYLHTS